MLTFFQFDFAKPRSLSKMKTNQISTAIRNFLRQEDGPTAVEYAIMLALIVAVCITAIGSVGTQASTLMENNADQMDQFMNVN